MWPVLFDVFGVQIQSYGASKALAAIVGALILGRRFRRLGYEKDIAYSLVMWATVWGFVAAKVYFLLDNWNHFDLHMLGSSGFVWYGGLVGGTIAVVVISRRHQLPLAAVAGSMAMPLSVAYGIGRIGCFLAGDGTYGKPTDLPWGMAFPNGAVPINVPVHPAQLYEAAAAFLIAAALWMLQDRLSPASVFGSYLVLSGIARAACGIRSRQQPGPSRAHGGPAPRFRECGRRCRPDRALPPGRPGERGRSLNRRTCCCLRRVASLGRQSPDPASTP